MAEPVPVRQDIRLLDAKGVPWREIARRLGVSRETVKKYAQTEDCSSKPAPRPARLDRAPDGGDHGTRARPAADPAGPRRQPGGGDRGADGVHGDKDAQGDRVPRTFETRAPAAAGRVPQSKELDGYDWTPVRFPVDYRRESLESLEFTGRHEDVVLFGPPGTGKTHLAIALGRKACREGTETRLSTVRRAGRAPAARQNGQPARQGTRHDRQGGAPDHRRARLRARR